MRFSRYGGVDVLDVVEVETPSPAAGQVLVEVRAAGINPGEASIREGRMHDRFPASFPSGQGSDLAGTVAAVGGKAAFEVGDAVLGFTDERASHAEYVIAEEAHLTAKPPGVPWTVAGGLKIAGTTAWAATRAVEVRTGDVAVVSAAAGGVGGVTAQLCRLRGVRVIGLASEENHAWLRDHGVVPLDYGRADLADAIRAVDGRVDAFLDCFGGGYVELALELGVERDRINTVADFAAAERHGVKATGGAVASNAEVLAELAALIDRGELELPIAATYPLDRVRDAYRELERRHTRGKIVLIP